VWPGVPPIGGRIKPDVESHNVDFDAPVRGHEPG
jgi:hypothetical protein